MLKRVRIRGYKSLADVDVKLKPLSVLFGPNAAGKSNFLDALQLLSRIPTSRTIKQAFEPPYRGKPLESFNFAPGGLDDLVSRSSASFSIEADVELSPPVVATVDRQIREMRSGKASESAGETQIPKGQASVRERNLRYRIEIEIMPKTGLLRVADEYLTALTNAGEKTKVRKPFLEKMGDRLHLRMEGQAHPIYYETYLDHSILSLPLYPPHYPHLVAMREELSRYFLYYFEPRERMRAPSPVKEARHIGLMGEDLAAFLNTLKALDLPQFRAVEKALHMIVPAITGIDVEVNSVGEVDLWLMEGKLRVPARVVSEGTLRMLGLLALIGAKEPPALVGFEEPENGIHPRRIRMIADLLRRSSDEVASQFIVTTHSPILPDLLPNESLFVCGKNEGKTEIKPFETWGPLGRQRDLDEVWEESLTPSAQLCEATSMRNIRMFAEDYGHEAVVSPLLDLIAQEYQVPIRITKHSVRGGHGKVEKELGEYVGDLLSYQQPLPDLIVVVTDSNCVGFAERRKRLRVAVASIANIVAFAIPDPHVERWLLLDAAAFKSVLGQPCKAPDQKCDRDRYKKLLQEAVSNAGLTPLLGGMEHADDIMRAMDLRQATRQDAALEEFIDDMRGRFRQWAEAT